MPGRLVSRSCADSATPANAARPSTLITVVSVDFAWNDLAYVTHCAEISRLGSALVSVDGIDGIALVDCSPETNCRITPSAISANANGLEQRDAVDNCEHVAAPAFADTFAQSLTHDVVTIGLRITHANVARFEIDASAPIQFSCFVRLVFFGASTAAGTSEP